MLSATQTSCTIYDERPICCRLYPIDIINRSNEIEWALYEYCPLERKQEAVLVVNSCGRMDHGLLLQAVRGLEELFGAERLQYLAKEDLVASKIELLDSHRNDYSVVGTLSGLGARATRTD